MGDRSAIITYWSTELGIPNQAGRVFRILRAVGPEPLDRHRNRISFAAMRPGCHDPTAIRVSSMGPMAMTATAQIERR